MDEQPKNEALDYSYELFKKDGYNKSFNEYKSLIDNNTEALDYSYELFKKDGYNKSIDDYKSLILPPTPKKDQADLSGESESVSADITSSSDSVSPEPNLIEQTTSQKFQDEATKELIEEYENKGVKDFNISQEEINKRADKIYQDGKNLDKLEEGFWSDTWKKIKANTSRALGAISGIPSFVNETMFTIVADDEQLAAVNKYPPEERRQVINSIINSKLSSPKLGKVLDTLNLNYDFFSDEIKKDHLGRAKTIEDEIIKFDTAISEDLGNGDFKKAGLRIASEGLGSIPSLVQAMIPYAGLPSIVAGAASEKSIELQEEGFDISGKTTANSLVSGAAEGLLEVFTKKLGTKLFKSMKNAGDDGAMEILDGVKEHLLKAPLKEGGSEAATSVVQNLSDAYIQGKEVKFNEAFKEVADAFLVGGAVGKGLGTTTFVVETVNTIKNDVKLNKVLQSDTNDYKTIKDAFIPLDSKEISIDKLALTANRNATKELDKDLTKSVNEGEIDQEQADVIKKEFLDTKDALNKTRGVEMSDKNRAKAVQIIREKEVLKREIKETDETLAEPKKQRVQELDDELRSLPESKTDEDLEQKTLDVEKQPKADTSTSRGVQQPNKVVKRSEGRVEKEESKKIDESKIEYIDFKEVDTKAEKPKDKVRPPKETLEEYVDNDGNTLIAETTKDGTKTFYYKQKDKSFAFGTGKKKTATQEQLIDVGVLSKGSKPVKTTISLDAGKGKDFEGDLRQVLQDKVKSIKDRIKTAKDSDKETLIQELNDTKDELRNLRSDPTKNNLTEQFDEQLDNFIEESEKLKEEKETKLSTVEKINKYISDGRKRTLGFVNKITQPIVSEVETIGSRLSELQMISKENANKYKKTFDKALSNYVYQTKLDKETAKVNLTGMVNDLLAPVDRNTTSKEAYEQLSKVSKELADSVVSMRTHIDSFSKIVTEDPAFDNLPEESKKNILDNLGNYVSQRYLYFKEKDYNPSKAIIKEATREEAKQIMIDEDIDYEKAINKAEKKIEGLLDKWENIRNPKQTYTGISTAINTLTMNDNTLKAKVRKAKQKDLWEKAIKEASEKYPKFKKNHKTVLDEAINIYEGLGGLFEPLPQHIKKLLGDIKLPESQYLSTMMAVGKMVYKAQALKNINARFFGEFIFDEQPTKDVKDYVQVDDKSSPLHKKWVNEFIAKEFEQEPIYETNNAFANLYYKFLIGMRKSKILPNPSTWFKNVTGGAVFAQIMNGNFTMLHDPKAFAKSIAGRTKMMFKGDRTKFTKEIFADAAEAGVLFTDINLVTMGYIDDMYSQMSLGEEAKAVNKFDKLQKTIRRKAGDLEKEVGQRYAQVDDYSKAMGVYMQKDVTARKSYGKEYKNLTDTERKDVLRQTGDDIKLSMPSFSRLPSWFKTVARTPMGDFVSFQIEATRSFIGSIAIAYNDAKTLKTGVDSRGNKINDIQKKAYAESFSKRAVGISLIVGFNLLLKHNIESFYRGWSDDDEEEVLLKKEAVKLRPSWVDDNLIIESIDNTGNAKFIDYSGQDPYAKTISMFHADYDSVKGMLEPNMLITLLKESYAGETDFGNEIFTKEDHPMFKFGAGLKHILSGFIPPLYSSIKFGAKKQKETDENWGSVGDWSSLVAERATFRKYDFNIYKNATRLAYKITDDRSVPRLGKSKNEKQVMQRVDNIRKIRDAIDIVNIHYFKNKNKKTVEGREKLREAITRRFSKLEKENLIFVSEKEFLKEVERIKKNPEKAIKNK